MIYAVNQKTREHKEAVIPACYAFDNEWHLVEADDDGWIPWEGGACPVERCTLVDVRHRDGGIARGCIPGRGMATRWSHIDMGDDIIAYRPFLEDKEQEWDGKGLPPVGCECECHHRGTYQGVVTVRYIGSELCVLLNHDHGEEQCGPIGAYKFRPIRIAVQRAEDEAMRMAGVFLHAVKDCRQDNAYDTCKGLYTAIRDGRIPGVKLEGE